MKKIIKVMSTIVLALGINSAMAISADKTQAHQKVVAKDSKSSQISYLFLLAAKKAQLKHSNAGNSQLFIEKKDLDRVITFSDRPYRIVRYTTGRDLVKVWSTGKNSFSDDPPNAALVAEKMKPHIVKIIDATFTHEHLILNIQPLNHLSLLPKTLLSPTLLIDGDLLGSIGEGL